MKPMRKVELIFCPKYKFVVKNICDKYTELTINYYFSIYMKKDQ